MHPHAHGCTGGDRFLCRWWTAGAQCRVRGAGGLSGQARLVKGAGEEKMFYLPTVLLFMLAFFVLLVLLFTLIMVGTISYAFDKVGLDPGPVFGLLLVCLAGSYVNIPLHRIRNEQVVTDQVAPFF